MFYFCKYMSKEHQEAGASWVQLVNPRHLHPYRRDWAAEGVAFSLMVLYSHHCSDGNVLGYVGTVCESHLLCMCVWMALGAYVTVQM